MPKAIVFDVDGTLIDSVDQHARSWADAFAAFGHAIGTDEIRRQIGKGGDQLLPVFLPLDEIERIGEELQERRAGILKQRYLPQIAAFPGVRALFERIIASGQRIALASSAKGDELDTYKRLAKIDDLLDTQTTSDDAERSKPEPDIFDAALQRVEDVDAEDVIVVGDTPYDAEAASKAGLRTVGVTCGGWSDAELRDAGCIATYRDPAELLRQFDSSPLSPVASSSAR